MVALVGLALVLRTGRVRAQGRVGGSILAAEPATSPWEKLPPMPAAAGRFQLAADERTLYRLGGVGFNIQAGQRYGRRFERFDPQTGRWQRLGDAPFGTGGALLSAWPVRKRFVAVAGIDRLGDRFNCDGVTVGVYDPQRTGWRTFAVSSKGLGRPAALLPWQVDRFLLLTAGPGLRAGEKIAILDVSNRVIQQLGEYPSRRRLAGAAILGGTEEKLYAVECGPDARVWSFSPDRKRWKQALKISAFEPSWTDVLFAWRGRLLMWVNGGPPYDRPSRMFHLDVRSEGVRELHSRFGGPRSRRSATGALVGSHFYVFGGQRKDDEWLADAHRYKLLLPGPEFAVRPAVNGAAYPDHIGDFRLRARVWQALPRQVNAVFVGPDQRVWYQLRHPSRKEDLKAVQEVIRRESGKPAPQLFGARPALFEPGGRVWFRTHSQRTLLGYDGKKWIVHPAPEGRHFIGNCPNHGRAHRAGCNLFLRGRAFFCLSQGVEVFDGKTWRYEQFVDKWPGSGKYPRLAPAPDGRSVLAYLPYSRAPLRWWRDGAWTPTAVTGLRPTETLADAVPHGKDEVWLFTNTGRIIRCGRAAKEPPDFAALVKQLGDDRYRVREKATAALIKLGPAVVPLVKGALAEARDPEVKVRLILVLRALGPGEDKAIVLGPYEVRGARLGTYDAADGSVYIVAGLRKDGKDLGTGLLRVDAAGRVQLFGGKPFAGRLLSRSTRDVRLLIVRPGQRVWLYDGGGNSTGMLLDRTGGVLCRLPGWRHCWLHAAKADGTVFVSSSDRHHSGVMVYQPAFRARGAKEEGVHKSHELHERSEEEEG